MKTLLTFTLSVISVLIIGVSCMHQQEIRQSDPKLTELDVIEMPAIRLDGDMSVEKAISQRRSIRTYDNEPLNMTEIAQLLWAGQGITDPATGKRAAPSAGATYPLEIYLVTSRVDGLPPGLYKYLPLQHALVLVKQGDVIGALSEAALDQECVREAAAVIVITAIYERTTQKYGERGIQYVYIETGHAAQNIFLQAQTLGLGTVVVGAFREQILQDLIDLESDEKPLYLMPVGQIK